MQVQRCREARRAHRELRLRTATPGRVLDLRFAVNLRHGALREWCRRPSRQGQAKVFKKYAMKPQLEREALQKRNREVHEALP